MREVIQQIPPADPSYAGLTIGQTPGLPDQLIAYEDSNNDGSFTAGVDTKFRIGPAELEGSEIARAEATHESGRDSNVVNVGWRVIFTLTPEGRDRFAVVTTRLVSKQLAIVLDGVILSAPTVQNPNHPGGIRYHRKPHRGPGQGPRGVHFWFPAC